MRYRGRTRVRATLATVSATLLAGTLFAGTLFGCAADDAAPAPKGTLAKPKPKPPPPPAWDRSPRSIAAVGDSITRGFDACAVLSDCPEASWATGTGGGVRSLAVRLLGRTAAATHSWNFARSGARMADLPEQMERAAEEAPELVTVLMGANDACRGAIQAMTPVTDFRSDFEAALGALRQEAPKAQVYVASIPDLKRLWSKGRSSPMGKQVWKLGICPTMLSDPDALDTKSAQRRDTVRGRVIAYNEALEDACAKDRYCRYDNGAVFDFRFDDTQLSHWDWFHPSKRGQSDLAELAFRGVTAKRATP